MTANPFTALLRDVPRHDPWGGTVQYGETLSADQTMLALSDVLAAIAAAVPADLAEAGKVAERLRGEPTWSGLVSTAKDAADLITALLARLAAQEAQIKGLEAEVAKLNREGCPADHALVDKYRRGGTGIFKFPEDVAAIIRKLDAAETALAAEKAKVAKLVEAGNGLHSLVEGIQGAMQHGTWRDEKGQRLKDTPEWVAFYNARAAITEAGQ